MNWHDFQVVILAFLIKNWASIALFGLGLLLGGLLF